VAAVCRDRGIGTVVRIRGAEVNIEVIISAQSTEISSGVWEHVPLQLKASEVASNTTSTPNPCCYPAPTCAAGVKQSFVSVCVCWQKNIEKCVVLTDWLDK